MSSQLEQLLGYLEREGVTEVLFGSGRPIAMRKAGAVSNITARPLSADQLANMLRGTELNALIPQTDGEGPTGEITVGRRTATAQVARRGNEIVVSLTRAKGATTGPGTAPLARVATPPASGTNAAYSVSATAHTQAATAANMTPIAPPRAKTPTPGGRQKTSTAVRAKALEPTPRMKSPDKAPRKQGATRAPKARTTTPTRGGGLVQRAPSSPTPNTFDFALEDGLELGAPVNPVDVPPADIGGRAKHDDGISLGSLDGGDFELDLGPPLGAPTQPPAPASFKVGFTSPPPPAEFDVDFNTSPPQAFAPAGSDDAFTNLRGDDVFAKPRANETSAEPGAHDGFARLRGNDEFAKPRSDDGIVRAPARSEQPDPFGRTGATESLDAFPQEIAHAGTQPIQQLVATGQLPPGARIANPLFKAMVDAAREVGASDLHIAAARVTSVRINNELVPLEPGSNPLSAQAAEELLMSLLEPAHEVLLEKVGYVDLAIEAPGGGRLRANISRQQQGLKGTFRLALAAPATLEQLGLPADLAKVVAHHQGLIVIAGPSGHGKTTTLAALVDLLNSSKPYHILTIEDPVEIVHVRKQAVISQREAGRHTQSFARGLKASLREDPDVIVIGELRDRESVEIALTAAETGHLVIATMSTPSAAKTIDRLIDMFPPEEHNQVRASVAGALRAIVAQRLLPKRGGGIVPVIELVTGVLPLAVLIRDDKLYQLPNLMQRGRAFGMVRFDESLAEHVRAGRLDEETALAAADSKKELAAVLHPAAPQAAKTSPLWGFGKKDSR